ncbi:pre-toxin TG domain-containing protein [Listeria immobilis]|uniref:pre-toxin TG domain-containing protein n=1 Tax=Listeria immobilis TaxID=2713502 RepID=UPI00289379A8|nr:pre-toxin TG domain-containing protein [Listeria immobilis]
MDSGDLKQSELEEQIRRVNELIHQANDLENQVRQSPLSEMDQQIQLQLNHALLEAYQTSKQELEEKLQKLIAFHASSPRIFSEIAHLKQAIDQGLAQTKTAWNSTTGTFVVPSQEKLGWANTIRAFQQKKEAQEEPDTTGRTYTRIDLGNGTYIWAWSKDGRTLTQDDIQFTVKHDKWAGKDGGLGKMLAQAEAKDFDPVKAIKEIADLFTPIGDGARVVTGEDPITGDKLSWGERGISLLFIIPIAKIGKYGGKGFKFIAEGVEDLNKLNKKADKVKDAEKSTKKASGTNQKVVEEITNPVLEAPRSGSGLKVDDIKPVKVKGTVYDIDPLTGKPSTKQTQIIIDEFPNVPKAHGFSDIIDNYAGLAEVTDLGNAKLYQIQGSQNGVMGRFEWIIQDGKVTHRMFVRNPELNGVPIK